jgi:hypothetical protein
MIEIRDVWHDYKYFALAVKTLVGQIETWRLPLDPGKWWER